MTHPDDIPAPDESTPEQPVVQHSGTPLVEPEAAESGAAESEASDGPEAPESGTKESGGEESGGEESGAAESGAPETIADHLLRTSRSAAVAESLTGGNVSARLSAVEGASGWFLGGLVAYHEEIKFGLLGVDRGPVVTAEAATQMAEGVARLLGADVTVATTGAGGPGPHEGKPQGTVFVAVHTARATTVREYHFDGDPPDVVSRATGQALADLAAAVVDTADQPAEERRRPR